MSLFFVTLPEHYRFVEHPTLVTAHPDGYVKIEAKDQVKAEKYANQKLDHCWSVMRPKAEFDPDYFPRGCVGRIRKDPEKGVVLESMAQWGEAA